MSPLILIIGSDFRVRFEHPTDFEEQRGVAGPAAGPRTAPGPPTHECGHIYIAELPEKISVLAELGCEGTRVAAGSGYGMQDL